MRILEICPFSSGICGVFARVLSESREFVKRGHKVTVFSSDIEKGTNRRVEEKEDIIEGVEIRRFPSRRGTPILLSKNVVDWLGGNIREIIKYNPDIIITHLLHPHSAIISHNIKKLKINNPHLKVFLVPHAPFNVERGFLLGLATRVWRKFALRNITRFDKVIAITKWEYPHLKKLGIRENKIVYIPNGLPKEYFTQKRGRAEQKVLFLGRIAPVKDIPTLARAAKMLPEVKFSLVGPIESGYEWEIKRIIPKNMKIYPAVYDLREKIKIIDKHGVFVLPSVREAMPQGLIEALARGKVVISSDTDGGKEIIENGKNGFLFKRGDYNALANLIRKNLRGDKKIELNAAKSAKEYSWEKNVNRYLGMFKR